MSDSARYDSWASADKHGEAAKGGECNDATVQALDKRIKTMSKELNYSLRRIGEKESEKFDLIFAILSELQNRQGKLEEAVRSFKTMQCGGGVAGFGGDESGQKNGAMCASNVQNGNAQAMAQNGCAPMNMQMVQCMPQVVIMSPTGGMNGAMNGGGMPMQYAMVSPNGAAQQMPGQMMQMMPGQMMAQMPSPSGGMCNENGELMQQQLPAEQQQQQPPAEQQQQQQQQQPQLMQQLQQQLQQPPAEQQQQQQPQASSQPEAPASSES